jgi:carboxylesterase
MRFLGERLHGAGFTVRGLRLPGHGTSVAECDRTTWHDWYGGVERELDALARTCRTVCIVGQSLGGLLALHAAARRPVAATAVLATPLRLSALGMLVARWAPGRIREVPKLGGSDVRDPDARRDNPSYRAIPTTALASLVELMRVVDDELPQVRGPLLVMHATHDHTAPVDSATRIVARAGATRLRTRILPESYHLIAIDVEREIVAAEVAAFFTTHAR